MTLWTACVTPFFENGDIDWESYSVLLKRQAVVGNGVLILGSTGESLSLSRKERCQIISFATSLNLQVPIMVGACQVSLEDTLSWINYCNNYDIEGVLVPPPMYVKPGIYGQIKWLEAVAEASTKRIMLYNIPSRVGVALYEDVVRVFKGHTKIMGIKDSSGTIDTFMQYRHISSTLPLFCGDDGLWQEISSLKPKGLISVLSNVYPEEVSFMLKQEDLSKDFLIAWNELCHFISSSSNPIPIKYLLFRLGIISSSYVRPPLSNKDLDVSLCKYSYWDSLIKDFILY